MNDYQILETASEYYSELLDADVEAVSIRADSHGEEGYLVDSSGACYRFVANVEADQVRVMRDDSHLETISAFYQGRLDSLDAPVGKYGPIPFYFGHTRADARNCSGGNKACGDVCISKDKQCRKKGGGAMKGAGKALAGLALAGGAAMAARGGAKAVGQAKKAAEGKKVAAEAAKKAEEKQAQKQRMARQQQKKARSAAAKEGNPATTAAPKPKQRERFTSSSDRRAGRRKKTRR